ncbi:MAG TPA: hypothetical protein VER09_07710 [Pseudomonas sp.]|nr:hypothetical protein [Pseudomonas sp.]
MLLNTAFKILECHYQLKFNAPAICVKWEFWPLACQQVSSPIVVNPRLNQGLVDVP